MSLRDMKLQSKVRELVRKNQLLRESVRKNQLLRNSISRRQTVGFHGHCHLQLTMKNAEWSLQQNVEVVSRLEQNYSQMAATVRDMEECLKQCQAENMASTETVRKISQQLVEKDAKRMALKTDLKIEREWRVGLQKSLEEEQRKYVKLHAEVVQLNEVKKEFEALISEYQLLQNTCDEQEKTLHELGSQLSQSKRKVEDLKEAQVFVKEAQWAEDKEATHCRQCLKPFSTSKRKDLLSCVTPIQEVVDNSYPTMRMDVEFDFRETTDLEDAALDETRCQRFQEDLDSNAKLQIDFSGDH